MPVRMICSGFVCVIIQILIGMAVYLGILIAFKDEFVYLVITRVRAKFIGILRRDK